jgi:hypothetical protein
MATIPKTPQQPPQPRPINESTDHSESSRNPRQIRDSTVTNTRPAPPNPDRTGNKDSQK